MRLRIYRSAEGDCLRVTGTNGGNILVDGGMSDSFTEHVRDDLCKMRAAGEKLDLVYISHIDADHIGGILQLLNDIMEWRVYRYQARRNPKKAPPKFGEPPQIDEIWHNAFSMLLKDNAGPVESLLAQSSRILGLSSDPEVREVALRHSDLAFSMDQAVQVSRRIAADQLGIPLNPQFNGRLILRRSPPRREAKVGAMELFVLGPAAADVTKLRDDWNAWLRGKGKDRIAELKRKADRDAGAIGNAAVPLDMLTASRVNLLLAGKGNLGNRKDITAPNLASVMLLLKEGARRLLLTGDGAYQDILAGLGHHKALDANGEIHVDVLKVQHHGARANIDKPFTDVVSADHYVFCGDGSHDNPEEDVVALVCDEHRKRRPADTFTLWFNSSSAVSKSAKLKSQMKKVEALVAKKIQGSGGRIRAKFLKQGSFDLTL